MKGCESCHSFILNILNIHSYMFEQNQGSYWHFDLALKHTESSNVNHKGTYLIIPCFWLTQIFTLSWNSHSTFLKYKILFLIETCFYFFLNFFCLLANPFFFLPLNSAFAVLTVVVVEALVSTTLLWPLQRSGRVHFLQVSQCFQDSLTHLQLLKPFYFFHQF